MKNSYKAYLVYDGNNGEKLQAVKRISDGMWMVENEYEAVEELSGLEIWEEIDIDRISCSDLLDFISDYDFCS